MSTNTDLVVANNELALNKPLGELTTWNDFEAVSEKLLGSGFCPDYIDTPATMASILMLGKELNMSPMSALQNIINVQGKLSLTSAGMIALLRNHNMRLKIIDDFVPVLQEGPVDPEDPSKGTTMYHVDSKTTIELWEMWNGEIIKNPITVTWSELVNAATEGGTKNLPNTYRKYAKHMAYARCVSRLIRSVAADVLAGSNYTTIEIGMDENVDMQVINSTVDIVHEDMVDQELEPQDGEPSHDYVEAVECE